MHLLFPPLLPRAAVSQSPNRCHLLPSEEDQHALLSLSGSAPFRPIPASHRPRPARMHFSLQLTYAYILCWNLYIVTQTLSLSRNSRSAMCLCFRRVWTIFQVKFWNVVASWLCLLARINCGKLDHLELVGVSDCLKIKMLEFGIDIHQLFLMVLPSLKN